MKLFKKIYSNLNLFYKSFFSKKKFFSFSGVDIIIENIFRNLNNGIYLDVGCQNPIKNNNTYLLYRKGWTGINIDLDQDNIDLFNTSRPNDTNICCAVSNIVGEKKLYFYHKKSPINTIDPIVSKYQKAKLKEVRNIKTDTLNNLLLNCNLQSRQIDFTTIDVEGHELEVLKGFDFSKYNPQVIVVEFLDLTLRKIEIKNQNIEKILNSELYKFITSKNYTLVNLIYADLVFVKNQNDLKYL